MYKIFKSHPFFRRLDTLQRQLIELINPEAQYDTRFLRYSPGREEAIKALEKTMNNEIAAAMQFDLDLWQREIDRAIGSETLGEASEPGRSFLLPVILVGFACLVYLITRPIKIAEIASRIGRKGITQGTRYVPDVYAK